MATERDQMRFQIDEPVPGNGLAVGELREQYQAMLLSTLVARGATRVEAEDLLADLWGDCVGRGPDRPPLLEKFSGKCPVQNWLLTVATHRLVDLKRRQKHRGELPSVGRDSTEPEHNPFEQLPAPAAAESESTLVALLKESLQAGFAQCAPETMLMLRLVYLNGLSQREVGRMWGWHESKISRSLTHAMTEIENITLRQIRQRDAWLELTWADFLALCESHEIGFL
jgi:RNA polymerase sigma factor (sigma-70 family)